MNNLNSYFTELSRKIQAERPARTAPFDSRLDEEVEMSIPRTLGLYERIFTSR